jgi:hypothetical protein
MWKTEAACKQIIEELTGYEFTSCRPNWLKNPETGRNLELDMYNDELKLGLEYNGYQHYEFPNRYHKNYDEYIAQVRRDDYKKRLCMKMGVDLIIIPHTTSHKELKDYIKKMLISLGYKL